MRLMVLLKKDTRVYTHVKGNIEKVVGTYNSNIYSIICI